MIHKTEEEILEKYNIEKNEFGKWYVSDKHTGKVIDATGGYGFNTRRAAFNAFGYPKQGKKLSDENYEEYDTSLDSFFL